MINPDAIYQWARKTLKHEGKRIRVGASQAAFEEAFWAQVEDFLGNPEIADLRSARAVEIAAAPDAEKTELPDEEGDAGQVEDSEDEELLAEEQEEDEVDAEEEDLNAIPQPQTVASAHAPGELTLRGLDALQELLEVLTLCRGNAFTPFF
jgi:hypothetical protein